MNLYQLHSDPESLYGYKEARYRIPKVAWDYVSNMPRGKFQRDPKIERAILQDPRTAVQYVLTFFPKGERWPEAEPLFLKDPNSAFHYVRHHLFEPWPEGESVIAQDPWFGYYYARDIKNARLEPENEKAIKNSGLWKFYREAFKF